MEVTDLQGYSGMAFVYEEDVQNAFYMRNTPMPLSIAWIAADGSVVTITDMEPCEDRDGCPSYAPSGPYRYAIEVPQGDLADARHHRVVEGHRRRHLRADHLSASPAPGGAARPPARRGGPPTATGTPRTTVHPARTSARWRRMWAADPSGCTEHTTARLWSPSPMHRSTAWRPVG